MIPVKLYRSSMLTSMSSITAATTEQKWRDRGTKAKTKNDLYFFVVAPHNTHFHLLTQILHHNESFTLNTKSNFFL